MSIDELAAKYANMSEDMMDVDAEGLLLIAFIFLLSISFPMYFHYAIPSHNLPMMILLPILTV